MSKFHNENVPTLGEILGTDPETKEEGELCEYCERGWGKGFTYCPQCGLKCQWADDEEL